MRSNYRTCFFIFESKCQIQALSAVRGADKSENSTGTDEVFGKICGCEAKKNLRTRPVPMKFSGKTAGARRRKI